ncbi:MAG TPA: transcription-repair coupling factor [Chlamydiales bacterium]|nr:transcription-repair coupling factor [Chlamydiales bacterium]
MQINDSKALLELETCLRSTNSLLFEGLWEPTKALLASLIAKNTQKSILVITGGVREDLLHSDLSYFDAPLEFPAWETLPGEEIPPSPDIIGKRFEALGQLLTKKTPSIVLCPLNALLQKIIPKKTLEPLLRRWKIGDQISFDQVPKILTDLGYIRNPVVSDKGQFAIRGGIVDLFPVAMSDPYRVEFFGDEIASIRTFDPVGQKSVEKVDSFFLCPAKETPGESTILDYLDDPWVFWDDLLKIEDSLVALTKMPGAKSKSFARLEDVISGRNIFCSSQNIEEMSEVKKSKDRSKYFQDVAFDVFGKHFEAKRFFHPFQKIEDLTDVDPNSQIIFLNRTEMEEEEVKKQIAPFQFQNVTFEKGTLTTGFSVLDLNLSIVPYATFSKRAPIRRQKWRNTHHTPSSEFHALSAGDIVVHYHSGIGKYLGMEKQKNHLGVETEFLILEYADQSKLFVPLSQGYLVSRYIGTKEESPHLSELGSKRWQKIRETATAQIVGYANDLLTRQAERVVRGGFQCNPDSALMEQFEREFPYVETEDQLLAIADIKKDMISTQPMDRLICGDVGYGKTEVAMRAAFKAVVDGGKQVAVLVPTTVLAMQHFETFSERMKGFPVTVEVVSRFRTPKQVKETLEKVMTGQVDILVGTHRLLSQDVHFKDLGLIIIDEEQRFGVRSKEHLKKLKIGVDCLTLSATPIPRTLHMSLITARDMSVINTPPQDRLPIKTIIAENEPELVQNALLREFARNGQAFYIHNRVETIYGRAEEIQKIVPQARIGVVHGQMDADDIDAIFHQFKKGDIDLLFATTIVESGVDIPNANTMLIDRADTYGLADLYQLRGRVGRWNRSAYTYFLVPKHTRMTEVARKRLSALADAGGFGGGMKIAMRDLEIRGAGDILGVQQSGQVSSIGFHLYCKLLKKAIDALKKKKTISFLETKMEFSFPAHFPDTYVNDVSLRMELYHRLGEASTFEDVFEIFLELKDRFGEPPLPVLWLLSLARIRVFAQEYRFTLLKFGQLSLLAERQTGKELKSHSIILPKKMQTPESLETYVISELKRAFEISE